MDKLSLKMSHSNFSSLHSSFPHLPHSHHNPKGPQRIHTFSSKVECQASLINLISTPLQSQSSIRELERNSQALPVAAPKPRKPQQDVKAWNPLQQMLAAALDMVERGLIQEFEKQAPLPDTANPNVQLAGNFFPVPENAVQHELEVEGKLPEGLEGVYVRNGANPKYKPLAGHHLFDGDGMLHAVRIKQGTASYANRFTRTHRFVEEERVGRPMFPKAIGELHGHSGVARLLLYFARACLGLINGGEGMGVANAGVVFFNGLLLAMSEDDLPYGVHISSDGDLQTLGKFNFNGQLKSSMIAHPKVDLESGELLALSYDVLKKPYLKYFKINKDGHKDVDVSIGGVNEPTMIHDFAITQHFVIIPDQQVIFKLQEMLKGGSPVLYAKDKASRFGVLPRDASDDRDMKWIDVPDCFCFHLWNAWEEDGDEIVVIGSSMTPPDSIFNESKDSFQSVLTEVRLNLNTLTSHKRVITPFLNLEAGQVNRKFLGRKSQYAYLAIAQPWPKVSGIAKVNLLAHTHTDSNKKTSHEQFIHGEKCSTPNANPSSSLGGHLPIKKRHPHSSQRHFPIINNKSCYTLDAHHKQNGSKTSPTSNTNNLVASFVFPPNCFGGEPMFVPRSLDPSAPEDDGYVLSFMHNEETCKSELLILDASSPSLEILASIKIPSRVPYGFHGTFITTQELEHQKSSLI